MMEHTMSDVGVLPARQQTLLTIKLDGFIEAAVQAAHARKIGVHEALSLTMAAVFREMAAHSLSRERAQEICVAALDQVYADLQERRLASVN